MESNLKKETCKQEEENKRYFYKLTIAKSFVMLIYTFIFVFYITFIKHLLNKQEEFFSAFAILLLGFSVCFILSWLLSMPFRIIIYHLSVQQGTLKQKFSEWLWDLFKILIISLFIPNLFFSISATLLYFQFHQGLIQELGLLLVVAAIFFIFKPVYILLKMWIVHGLYVLNSGDMFTFTKDFLVSKHIKEYPIVVLPIASKSTYANAFAIGTNKFGCILISDVLLNNLAPRSFLSVILHENSHLKNNDVPKRTLLIGILLILLYFMVNGIVSDDWSYIFSLIACLSSIFVANYYKKNNKAQELQADLFAATQLGSGKYMIEALEYIYSANSIPKEKIRSSSYPKLKERIEKLQSIQE